MPSAPPDHPFLFTIRYGDDWTFALRCDAVQDRPLERRVKRILIRTGESPEQYPDNGEEEDLE